MKLRLIYIFLILICGLHNVLASNRLEFEYITSNDGLTQATVTNIVQDTLGFMWFGTRNGLNRYDGYNIVQYYHNPHDSTSLPSNIIEKLLIDSHGNLWIGTSEGICRYNYKLDKFENYLFAEEESNKIVNYSVSAIYEDSKGKMWVGIYHHGLNLFNHENDSFTHYYHQENNPNSLSNNNIHAILEDENSNLWIATEGGGLNLFNRDTKQFIVFENNPNDPSCLPFNNIWALAKDNYGKIWVGTMGAGLCRVIEESKGNYSFQTFQHTPSNNNRNFILSICPDAQNGLWIGTNNGGLDYFNIETKEFTNYTVDEYNAQSINSNSVQSVYIDKNRNLWLGTFTGGVNVAKKYKKNFETYRKIPGYKKGLSFNAVSCFFEDASGYIWVGTDGGGLNRFNRETREFLHYNLGNGNFKTDAILSVCQDNKGVIWAAGWGCGLSRYSASTNKFTNFPAGEKGIPNNDIFKIFTDSKGRFWALFGGQGFGRFDETRQQFKIYNSDNSQLPINWVISITEDLQGNIILGHTAGFCIFDPANETFTNFAHERNNYNSLSGSPINNILCTHDSMIWIGAVNGLNRYNPKSGEFTSYFEINGLSNDNALGLLEDDRGNVWISTDNGINKFDPKDESFKKYTLQDGLQGRNYIRNSCYKTRNGELLFGGTDGFNLFHPDSLFDNPIVPHIVLTDFQIFNKKVHISEENSPLRSQIFTTNQITLDYNQSVITFEFSALDFTSPQENKYAYYLEGFEKDWNYVGTKRTATYTNLDAGTYIFHVKGSNNDNVWNETGVSLYLTVTPPYWETWWFRIGAGVIGFFIVFAYFIIRMRTIKKNNILLEGLVDKRTRELSSKNDLLNHQKNELNEINTLLEERQQQVEEQAEELLVQKEELERINNELTEVNATKDKFFSIIAHDIKNPFGTIMGFVELMQLNFQKWNDEKKFYYLNIIAETTKNVYSLLDNLLQWSRSQRGVMEFHPQKIKAGKMVSSVIDLFKNVAEAKEIKLQAAITENDYMITVDEHMLDTILRNLVSNAIKFTPRKGTISLSYSKVGSKIVFKVQDTGMGMNDSQLNSLFQIDSHQSSEGTEHEKGTGIGLILTKDFVERHSGKIWAESKPGEGATFSFELPIDS